MQAASSLDLMAASTIPLHLLLFIFFFLLLPLISLPAAGGARYPVLFGFGNSLTDTGNLAYFLGDKEPAAKLPYGETYFHHPTGRYSDGRLVIDFLAQALGLPLVPPYRAGSGSEDLTHGANFAVAGACALGNAFFAGEGMNVTWPDYSFGTQLRWFEDMLTRSFPSPSGSEAIVSKSLFFLGEMGINDYTHLLIDKNARTTIHTYIPTVVHAITSMVEDLIRKGARTLIVAGITPLGCSPMYLTFFQSQNVQEYEPQTGCLRWANEFVRAHNLRLQKELSRLRKVHPRVQVIYADFYDPLIPFYTFPREFGLKEPLVGCCGGGGPYNFSFPVPCGAPNSTLCSDPSAYVSWDGLHLTEASYSAIASRLSPPLSDM